MKHFFLSCIILSFLSACSENTSGDEPTETPVEEEILTLEQRFERHAKSTLEIPATENFKLKIYSEHLNHDGLEDAIITVNRLDYAIDKAKQGGNFNKSVQLDFFGNYNCFFFYNSETDQISAPIFIASTPFRELKVSFEHISSDQYKDPIIDYPVRNSEFRRYYPIIDGSPTYVFQWKVYDGWGTDELEAYCFTYSPGSYSSFRDIIVNKADMVNIQPGDNYDTIHPSIECTEKLDHRFFYNPKDRKYYTPTE